MKRIPSMSLKPYIDAIRPRTLFLALACSFCGNALALFVGQFNIYVCILTILTASSLQILSNLANDYGDFAHGTDVTGRRIGPVRTLQSGAITPQRMKLMMVINVFISIALGLALLFVALQFTHVAYLIFFIVLGAFCIVAAIKYTVGRNPYGYCGFGDLFSFIFFGLVSIVGTYFLHTREIGFLPWLPAIGFGFPTAAVLNVNNMRDMENDAASGKITIPILIGFRNAKIYHASLIFGSFACFVVFNILYLTHWYQYLYLLIFAVYFKFLAGIFKTQAHERRQLDPYLKYTSITTFFLSLAFAVCINI